MERPLPDIREQVQGLLGPEPEEEPDRPVAELLRQRAVELSDDVKTAVEYIESFHAAALDKIGSHALAEAEAAEAEDGEQSFRVREGYSRLADWLRARLPTQLVELRLETTITEIAWRPGRVRVSARDWAGRPSEITGSKAIITLPLGVLKATQGTRGAVRIDPEPPGWQGAFGALHMGAAQRIVLHFDEIWWARPDDSLPGFVHGGEEAFPVWWTSLPKELPILTGWTGGPRAAVLAGLTPGELLSRAVKSAAAIFGQRPKLVRDRLVQSYAHDWVSDPLALGAYSYGGVGARPARRLLATPISDTLFLAGEATAEKGRNATVHGALASGRRAAAQVLGH
jgi:monoamine oxidase